MQSKRRLKIAIQRIEEKMLIFDGENFKVPEFRLGIPLYPSYGHSESNY